MKLFSHYYIMFIDTKPNTKCNAEWDTLFKEWTYFLSLFFRAIIWCVASAYHDASILPVVRGK